MAMVCQWCANGLPLVCHWFANGLPLANCDVLAKSGSDESCKADCQVPVLARSPTIVGKSCDLDKYI